MWTDWRIDNRGSRYLQWQSTASFDRVRWWSLWMTKRPVPSDRPVMPAPPFQFITNKEGHILGGIYDQSWETKRSQGVGHEQCMYLSKSDHSNQRRLCSLSVYLFGWKDPAGWSVLLYAVETLKPISMSKSVATSDTLLFLLLLYSVLTLASSDSLSRRKAS